MDRCVECGHELGVGRFCTNCGHAVGAPATHDDTAERAAGWRTDTAERPRVGPAPAPPPAAAPTPTPLVGWRIPRDRGADQPFGERAEQEPAGEEEEEGHGRGRLGGGSTWPEIRSRVRSSSTRVPGCFSAGGASTFSSTGPTETVSPARRGRGCSGASA